MTFLSGELLAFLGALGLPILVHLLNLRRRRTRDIPTLRFLLEIESTRLRRVKLTRWLLLLLRMLLLAALVLAFARPLLKGAAAFLPRGGESRALVLLLDDSASSRLPSNGAATVWDRVRQAALERLDALGPKDQVWLLSLSRPDEPQGPMPADAARVRLGQWKAGWGRAQVDKALAQCLAALEEAPPLGRQLVLLSDLRLPVPKGWEEKLPEALSRVLIQVPSEGEQAAPVDLQPQGSLRIEGRALELGATVEGAGVSRGLTLSLELEGETRAREGLTADDEGVWRAERTLSLPLPQEGWHKGWLRLSGDAVDVDNALPFVLQVEKQRKVGVLGASPALRRVLNAALLPDARYGQGVELVDLDLARSTGGMDQAVVVVGGAQASTFTGTLRALAASGVGLLVLPHPDATVEDLGRQLDALGLPGPAILRQGRLEMDQADRGHPLLSSIFSPGPQGKMEKVEVRRWMELQGPKNKEWRTLVYAGGQPLILSRQGQGAACLLLATTADAEWSGLAASGFLAPFLQQGLRWMKGDDRLPPPLDCGEAGEMAMPAGVAGRDWQLRRDGAMWRCVPNARRQLLQCPPLPEPGHYELLVDGQAVAHVAVRMPARECTLPVASLDAWKTPDAGGWTVRRLKEDGDDAAMDLGPWLLGLALALLAVEGWLAAGRRSS